MVVAEDPQLRAIPMREAKRALDESSLAALARAASESQEIIERELRAENAQSRAQALRYRTAFDAIAQGVCIFDAEKRLILSNRRYAEIYRLAPEQVRPGATLREIVELRVVARTCETANADDYLSFCERLDADKEGIIWTAELQDGRTIQIHHQPMPGGGWILMHEDVTELKPERASANERLSLQALIDCLPDSLWVKDANSRFVIANKTTADRWAWRDPRT